MKKLFFIPVLIVLFQLGALAQVGSSFPSLSGKDLNDKQVTFPIKGKKPTLLILAYSQKSQADLETWVEPLYKKFVHKSEGVFGGFDDGHDVDVYFIPMIKGINKAAYGKVESELKKKTDPKLKPYLVVYKGGLGPYKKILSLDNKDKPYLYLVNQKGKIVYATSAAYTADKLNALQEQVDKCYK